MKPVVLPVCPAYPFFLCFRVALFANALFIRASPAFFAIFPARINPPLLSIVSVVDSILITFFSFVCFFGQLNYNIYGEKRGLFFTCWVI